MRSQDLTELVTSHFFDGNLVWEPNFVSTSSSKQVALGYCKLSAPPCMLFVYLTAADGNGNGADLGAASGEVLFPPSVLFKQIGEAQIERQKQETVKCNGFVDNSNIGQPCGTEGQVLKYTFTELVTVTFQEATGAERNKLVLAQREVEGICTVGETFILQCGKHSIVEKAKGAQKVGRFFAGTTISECSHAGRDYSCSTKSNDKGCYACVLCKNDVSGAITARHSALPDTSCTGRGQSLDGFYFK